uniref:Serine protease persephone n=1 Tax=Ceratitis capitata TaxID=7213 RepID=W8C1Q0_CERCA
MTVVRTQITLCLIVICGLQSGRAGVLPRPAIRACEEIDAGLRENFIPHVAEGTPVALGKFPYMAIIGHRIDNNNLTFPCSGALIDKRFVVAAGHCLKNGMPVIVRLGVTNLDNEEQRNGMIEKRIKAIHLHPEYTTASAYNDIGLVELDSEVSYSSSIYPVCLHTAASVPLNNTELYATRWGVSGQKIVGEARARIVPLPLCRDAYSNFVTRRLADGIRTSQLCAHDVNAVADDCNVASGPMILVANERSNKYRLIGIDSFGARCNSQIPNVLTRVSEYLDFIESLIWPH